MIKILVFSDSHGDIDDIENILLQYPNINDVIFLGDCAEDIKIIKEKYSKKFYIINGNCDTDRSFEEILLLELDNVKILCTHGHLFELNNGINKLKTMAVESGVSLVLYGHTHNCSIRKIDNILFLNPGAIGKLKIEKYVQSFAILYIVNDKVEVSIKTLPMRIY